MTIQEAAIKHPDCIRTHTGLYMNVFEPTLEMICIEDIAHALSNICRFGGHATDFYSVAQHSCLCAFSAPPPFRLDALLHDASEAYLLDMPSPIKRRLDNYQFMERRLMRLISEKFAVQYPISETVKTIDTEALEFEWQCVMLQKKVTFDFVYWPPAFAKAKFLEQFYTIMEASK